MANSLLIFGILLFFGVEVEGGIPDQPVFGGRILIGCDPQDPSCFYYTGRVGIGKPCMSEKQKKVFFEGELDKPSQGAQREDLISNLHNESCKISQATECRQRDPSSGSPYVCACVDPTFGDVTYAVVKSKYVRFDEHEQSCSFRVRYRCSNFTIPESGRRFNKTSDRSGVNVTVMDGRPMWYAYRCGNNSRCNVRASDVPTTNTTNRMIFYVAGGTKVVKDAQGKIPHVVERASLNKTRGKCICEQGSMPDGTYEDAECRLIDKLEWGSKRTFEGFCILLTGFYAVYTIILGGNDPGRYYDRGARQAF